MRDTSHSLVINKQAPHPIKHLTSPCSSPITNAIWTHMEGISKSVKRVQYVSLGLGQGRPPHPPVCLSVGWWEHHPDACSAVPLLRFAFIFRCGAQITRLRLCTRRRGNCRVCRGFCKHAHLLSKMTWMRWSYWLPEWRGCVQRRGPNTRRPCFDRKTSPERFKVAVCT